MLPSKNASQPAPPQIHWFSACQFGLSVLAIFALWSLALAFVTMALTAWLAGEALLSESLPQFMPAVAFLASGALLLPSAGYALRRLLGRAAPDILQPLRAVKPGWLVLIFPLLLLLGFWLARTPSVAWLALPAVHILAVGVPVLWLLSIALRQLPLGSPQRTWGVFGAGLVLGPALILALEGLALLGGLLAAGLFIAGQPDMMRELTAIMRWVAAVDATPEMISDRFSPFLTRPGVMFSVIAYAAVIVPLIEEAFKPIGVWLLVGRDLSPKAGFAAGALCGAGYGLFENLAIASGGEEWAGLVVARAGTAVVHILTTALTGWALASAWRERRYLRLGVTYLAAVLLHSLWNGATLLTAFASLDAGAKAPAWLARSGEAAPYGLVVLAVGGLFALWQSNKALRAGEKEEARVRSPETDTQSNDPGHNDIKIQNEDVI